MNKAKNFRIAVFASSGGHLTQVLSVSRAWEGYSTFYVSTSALAVSSLEKMGRFYIIEETGRGRLLKSFQCFVQSIRIFFKERPHVIISGGAGSGIFLCIIGKIFGSKIVWLDSIANMDRMSLGGRLTRPFVDLCIVQWPQLAAKYRNVEYWGQVI